MKLLIGNWYKIREDGNEHVGQYIGKTDFGCCVCGKGCKAKTFNIWYDSNGFESWGFGNEHLPEIIEDLGARETVIVDK